MSFYGSIYYQATDAIAKIIIKNSGINNKEFLTGDLPEFIQLDADGRSSELRLDSGNRWIRLEGVDEENRCSFYHGQPDHNTDTFINMITKKAVTENEDKETVIEPGDTVLNVEEGVRFSVPLIYYDKAGHLAIPEDGKQLTQTFVMPKITSATEIDKIKDDIKDINIILNQQNDRILLNENEIKRIDGTIEGINNSVQQATANAAEANSNSQLALNQINATNATVNAAIEGLSARIAALERG